MAKKSTGLRDESLKRKDEFLAMFARESQEIRDAIASELPAYNELLSITGLTSFRELALQALAEQRGVPYDKNKPEKPLCPQCGKADRVIKKADLFLCKACGTERFAATRGTLAFDTKRDAIVWMKALRCILNRTGVTKTCELCGFYRNTYYNIFKHLVYCMELILKQELRLYGNIQVDVTFVPVSYKGARVMDVEYPEDSIFYDDSPKPERESRKRGGAYSQKDWDANHIAIFTAIDDRSHAYVWGCGLGKCTWLTLKKNVPRTHFLKTVPEQDPFGDLMKKTTRAPEVAPGNPTIFISDKEGAIPKFINSIGYTCESHVYRKNDTQLKLGEKTPHIQAVNALHHRLKKYLRDIGYVSAALLPAYLMMFNFIENTRASDKAVERLFKTLVAPGLWQPSEFFENRYVLPNYLMQRLAAGAEIAKLGARRLTAYRLFDRYKRPEDYPKMKIPSLKEIAECTHYTETSIRRIYNTLNKENVGQKILEFFGEATSVKTKAFKKRRPVRGGVFRRVRTLKPPTSEQTMIMFEEYVKVRILPAGQRPSFEVFTKAMNERFKTDIAPITLYARFLRIEEETGRKMPPLGNGELTYGKGYIPQNALTLFCEFDAIMDECDSQGDPMHSKEDAYAMIGMRHNLTQRTVEGYVSKGRAKYKKEHPLEMKRRKYAEYIELYEEWRAILSRPVTEQIALIEFVQQINARNGKQYTRHQMKKMFVVLQEEKICEPLPEAAIEDIKINNRFVTSKMLAAFDEYIEIIARYRESGKKMQKMSIQKELSVKYDISFESFAPCLTVARRYREYKAQKEGHKPCE